jgi:signal transduction histidine kinase
MHLILSDMTNRLLTWKSFFFITALLIIGATLYYTNYLAKKIETEERQRVSEWIAATQALLVTTEPQSIALANMVIHQNEDMPLIATDTAGNIVDYHNLDTVGMAGNPAFLSNKLLQIQDENPPIEWELTSDPPTKYLVYYGNTELQKEVRYYPLVQLLLVSLFIILLIALISTQNRSTQNQVWAGMAKETAHQMGTPLTSLQGWIEVLRGEAIEEETVSEIEKDVDRLKLVSDRFSKIGSSPKLEEWDLSSLVDKMVDYMKRRASGKVKFQIISPDASIRIAISPTLLDWVLENLIKNALDAMEGSGNITVTLKDLLTSVVVDVADTGKGMTAAQQSEVFKPGYSTKKRGWGLGLTLSKRIVEQYHKGQLFVKATEPGKGTTFRIILPR